MDAYAPIRGLLSVRQQGTLMTFIEALQSNSAILTKNAEELVKRIDAFKKNGHPTDTAIRELVAICKEIGRLGDAIKHELDSQ